MESQSSSVQTQQHCKRLIIASEPSAIQPSDVHQSHSPTVVVLRQAFKCHRNPMISSSKVKHFLNKLDKIRPISVALFELLSFCPNRASFLSV